MGSIIGHVSDEMPGGRPRGQASTVHDLFQANAGDAAAGALNNVGTTYASVSVSRNYETNSATIKDPSSGHPHHPSPLPEDVQFLLYTLPVNASCVGDGDGFTAYVDTADPREAADVPQEVHEALSARPQTRRHQKYQRMDALLSGAIDDAGYKGIDAPELKMEHGKKSRDALVNLIKGKCVVIYVYGKDQFGRYIGDIYCDGVLIQEQMLKRGFAWHFKIYDKRREFGQWEREARAARRGLWLSDNPKKPWEWRREQRKAEQQDSIQMDNGSCEALSRMIKEKKNAEERAREWRKECESAVAENLMLNDLLRESKEELQNEKEAYKQLVKQMAIGVGTSMLIVGIAVLFRGNKGKTPIKKNGVDLLFTACKQLLM